MTGSQEVIQGSPACSLTTLRGFFAAMTTKGKRDFVKKMHSANAEGLVCKNRNAVHAGGRAGQHFKCKFFVTASFIVGGASRRTLAAPASSTMAVI
jgi:ATP-dependent DNA ligase